MKEYLKKFVFFIVLCIVAAVIFRMVIPKTFNVHIVDSVVIPKTLDVHIVDPVYTETKIKF